MKSRAYVFTDYGIKDIPDEERDPRVLVYALAQEGLPKQIRYLVCQLEKCPTTGRLHLQGYLEMRTPQRKTWFHKHLSPSISLQKRMGTREQAREYAMKKDTWVEGHWEFGTWINGGQGSRNDIKKAVEVLKNTNSLQEVAKQCPVEYVKYHRGFAELKKKLNPNVEKPKYKLDEFLHEPLDLTKSVELVGDSGLGKTEFALAHFESPLKVTHIDELREFDSKIHDGIVFDDVSFLHTPIQQRIHLLEYERQASIHVRYDYVTIPAQTKKIFTINPDKNGGDAFLSFNENISMAQRNAILRRLNIVKIETSLFE